MLRIRQRGKPTTVDMMASDLLQTAVWEQQLHMDLQHMWSTHSISGDKDDVIEKTIEKMHTDSLDGVKVVTMATT